MNKPLLTVTALFVIGPADGDTADIRIEKRERQVIGAVGDSSAIIQPPLVGEGRALGKELVNAGKKHQREEQGLELDFHE